MDPTTADRWPHTWGQGSVSFGGASLLVALSVVQLGWTGSEPEAVLEGRIEIADETGTVSVHSGALSQSAGRIASGATNPFTGGTLGASVAS